MIKLVKRHLATLALAGFVALLSGCAGVSKVGPGEAVVGTRVVLQLDAAWNQLDNLRTGTATTWTQDGITLDLLQLFVAVKDGELLAPTPNKNVRPLAFNATMEPHELAALFQGLYTRDGSSFQLDLLEPSEFLGGKGFRFRYTVLRKADDVKLSGVAWAAVRNKELFAITFTAPRMGFFPRHEPQVELVARSARFKP